MTYYDVFDYVNNMYTGTNLNFILITLVKTSTNIKKIFCIQTPPEITYINLFSLRSSISDEPEKTLLFVYTY